MTHHSAGACTAPFRSATLLRAPPVAVAFVPMLVALWVITHRYQGLARDGELYAVQALARIEPQLATDLYLQYTSQDLFTVFSPLYAALIRVLGLQHAELTLFLVCSVWFLTAIWVTARQLWDEPTAWFTVAVFIVTVGYYGAYQIFAYSENYLTARSLSEALVVTSLACQVTGRRRTALAIAVGALLIHPLMALPGLILLLCLWLPVRAAVALTAGGTATALAVALAAAAWPHGPRLLTVMDPAWLEVVRQRSQFLFLKYWGSLDWEIAARPFVGLTLAALVMPEDPVRKLCIAGMLVGASGLAVSYVACTVGPVALLLQGQAWRWEWVIGCLGALMAVPTALRAWRDSRGGPLCAILLVCGWIYTEADSLLCIDGALLLWLVQGRIPARTVRLLNWTAVTLVAIIVATVVAHCCRSAVSPVLESSRESGLIARMRDAFGIGMTGVLVVIPCGLWLKGRGALGMYAAAAVFTAAAALVIPGSVKQLFSVGTPAEIAEFADWRARIPPDSTVLMIPTTKAASFAWFTLNRPSYLSVDQSAGVVFSPDTAREVRRRAEVLLPVAEPDWQILTQILETRAGRRKRLQTPVKLTADALLRICRDPALGFVIASENVGHEPLTHHFKSGWNNWNLYDCRHIRDTEAGA